MIVNVINGYDLSVPVVKSNRDNIVVLTTAID